APAGAPADSSNNASGISKNVGIASGTAISATRIVATDSPREDASAPTGNDNAIAIETTTPTMISGSVLIATCPHECRKRTKSGRLSSATTGAQLTGFTLMNLSIIKPVKNTTPAETTSRVVAMR